MKQLIFTSALILASAMAGEATAACSGTQITETTGTHETGTPTFKGLANGQFVTVAGLTFTANQTLTATQVSSAFKSLSNGATTGQATNLGAYSGTLTGWSSGAGTGTSQIFTSIYFGNVANLSSTVFATNSATKPGTTAVDGTAGTPLLTNLLTDHTVCEIAGDAVAAGPDKYWGVQEEHLSGGILKDYKRGPLSTRDPPTQTGNWSVTGSGASSAVNYTYLGGGGSGSYNVYDNLNGSYDFCNGANRVATVTIVNTINTGCPGFAHDAP